MEGKKHEIEDAELGGPLAPPPPGSATGYPIIMDECRTEPFYTVLMISF